MPRWRSAPDRRATGRAVAGAAALLAVVAACSSGRPSSQPTSAAAPSGASSSAATGGEVAQVAQVWTTFFAGTTPADRKIALVEDGPAFADVITAQASSPISTSTTATVSHVALTAPDRAQVTYTISLGGTPALPDQTGTAVLVDGSWRVGAASFCQLLALQGTAPPVCATATTATTNPA